MLGQKCWNHKAELISQLEGNSLDGSVSRIVDFKPAFAIAQAPVLRACQYASPIESVRKIVLSIAAVEDLFVFAFGERPEANQLMPMLARLFITTPVPAPLMFGRWLAHFVQVPLQMRSEWFGDAEMAPLEHYFQFNQWIEEMVGQFPDDEFG